MKILDNILLKIAYSALDRRGGHVEMKGMHIVRMSDEFYEWAYNKGYKIFEEKQQQKENFAKSLRKMDYKHNYLL